MQQTVSKSQFKPKVLEYLRLVELNKEPLIITHDGIPVVQVLPYSQDPKKSLEIFRGTVKKYVLPTSPVGVDEWEVLK